MTALQMRWTLPPKWVSEPGEGSVLTAKTCQCPHCNAAGLLVPIADDVDYYRCHRCAQVWTVPKDKPEPSGSVTVNVKVFKRR